MGLKLDSYTTPQSQKSMHHSYPTLTSLTIWTNPYDEQNSQEFMPGTRKRMITDQLGYHHGIEVELLMREEPLRGLKLMLMTSCGSNERVYQRHPSIQASPQCLPSSNSLHRTPNLPRYQFLPLLEHLSSPTQIGHVSSQEWWSISTMSFWEYTPSPMITKRLNSLEAYRSSMVLCKWRRRSVTLEIGHKLFGYM